MTQPLIPLEQLLNEDLESMTGALAGEFAQLADRRLLITGGGGFLGYYLTQAVTHWNAVDNTVQGLTCTTAPAFGVQFAPPAASGSDVSDAGSLYARFRQLLLSPVNSK